MVKACTSTSVDLPLGDVWQIVVEVVDYKGVRVDDVPVVTITLPGGSTSTPTVTTLSTGSYLVSYVVGSAGRYIARAVTSLNGAVDFTAFVTGTVAASGMPTVADYRAYAPDGGKSISDATILEALNAESAAQRNAIEVPASYPADLREALLRRTMRNLAMRTMPYAVPQGSAEGGPDFLPGNDPEVKRLEKPYQRWVVG